MSHFVIGAIMEKEKAENDLEGTISNLLEPYDEKTEVPEYEKKCYCIQMAAQEKAKEIIEKETGKTVEDFRREIADISDWGEKDKKWKELTEDYFYRLDEIVLEQTLEANPVKTCETCKGTGLYKTTYNPNSKWDWYVIGGRWDGLINGKNVVSVKETIDYVKESGSLFGFITPNGIWAEKGEMGYFGCSSNNKKEKDWERETIEILESFNSDNFVVVLVDCHI
jgi:hypothetical protein